MDRRERLFRSRLYVVTDAREARGDLTEFLDEILSAGVDIIQLREKDAEAGDLLRWGETFKALARKHGSLFVLNDRPDVAAVLEADGVHVGQNDLPVEASRRFVGSDAVIGLSTHDAHQLETASPDADYVCVGPVYQTPTKDGRPATGPDYVTHAAKRETRPWFAIGGINEETLPDVVEAGARRIVVVRAVTEADDPADAVRRLLKGLPEL
ncbi:MAG: thiamine phosphate synthase [Actinomycetota bacterium]|nr:thiamine phosphate synthase [Actinomycetota bacterium]